MSNGRSGQAESRTTGLTFARRDAPSGASCNACLASPPLRKCRVAPKPTLKSRISGEADGMCAILLLEAAIDRLGPLAAEASVSSQMRIYGIARDAGRSAGATDVRVESQRFEQWAAPGENSLWSARDLIRCLELCGFAARARRYRQVHEWAAHISIWGHYRTRIYLRSNEHKLRY